MCSAYGFIFLSNAMAGDDIFPLPPRPWHPVCCCPLPGHFLLPNLYLWDGSPLNQIFSAPLAWALESLEVGLSMLSTSINLNMPSWWSSESSSMPVFSSKPQLWSLTIRVTRTRFIGKQRINHMYFTLWRDGTQNQWTNHSFLHFSNSLVHCKFQGERKKSLVKLLIKFFETVPERFLPSTVSKK